MVEEGSDGVEESGDEGDDGAEEEEQESCDEEGGDEVDGGVSAAVVPPSCLVDQVPDLVILQDAYEGVKS